MNIFINFFIDVSSLVNLCFLSGPYFSRTRVRYCVIERVDCFQLLTDVMIITLLSHSSYCGILLAATVKAASCYAQQLLVLQTC